MIVVVLSVCPEKLRGELTRWLLEISTGVYVGHVPARVRELLWLRIVDDVGRGRALMVHSARGEQGLAFRVHNHAWEPVDVDGITLMRRVTAESRELARTKQERAARRAAKAGDTGTSPRPATVRDERAPAEGGTARNWSKAARRRRFKNEVERRHQSPGDSAHE